MNNISKTFICLCFSLFCLPAFSESQDTLAFSVYRHTYVEGETSVSFKIKNPSQNISYLVQSKMNMLDETTGVNILDKKENPFFITPPLQKLEPEETFSWRVLFTGDPKTLPTDRESIYIASFRVIPATDPTFTDTEQKRNVDKFQLTTIQVLNFKVYYRPKQFEKLTIEEERKKITFRYDNDMLIVKNNSPIYMAFDKLSVDGEDIKDNELLKLLIPFEEQKFKVKTKLKPNSEITWQILDELALPLAEQEIVLK